MNRRAIQVVTGFALLVGLTAAVLVRVRANYVLGQPGVKLVNVPIYNDNTNLVSNVSVYLPEKIGKMRSARIEPVTTPEQQMLPPDTIYGRRVYSGPDNFKAMISIVLM